MNFESHVKMKNATQKKPRRSGNTRFEKALLLIASDHDIYVTDLFQNGRPAPTNTLNFNHRNYTVLFYYLCDSKCIMHVIAVLAVHLDLMLLYLLCVYRL